MRRGIQNLKYHHTDGEQVLSNQCRLRVRDICYLSRRLAAPHGYRRALRAGRLERLPMPHQRRKTDFTKRTQGILQVPSFQ